MCSNESVRARVRRATRVLNCGGRVFFEETGNASRGNDRLENGRLKNPQRLNSYRVSNFLPRQKVPTVFPLNCY